MSTPLLSDRSWQSIYESQPTDRNSNRTLDQGRGQGRGGYLVDEFYVPALERSVRYDRVAGYFSSSALAVASRGIDALVENGGEMRLVVGTELYETDRPVLEALTDELSGALDELDDERLDAQLQLLARYLREDALHIKVAAPRQGTWRIFHPKMGIFHDANENTLSFEGSVNETVGGWRENYERFKVHRSWVDGQADYVGGDVATFEQLWSDEHPYVEVHDLPDAITEELIEWKDPNSDTDFELARQIVRGEAPPTERDKANIIADGPLAPGGLALAEEASTITPWPHQRVVSDTLVNTYPQSFLLCDEVGLGKTIEAGLTLSRLGLTDELETGLLLVPASLTIQWQEELWEKFNLDSYRFARGSDYEYAFIDAFGREHAPPTADDLYLDADQREEAWVNSPIWRFIHAQQAVSARQFGDEAESRPESGIEGNGQTQTYGDVESRRSAPIDGPTIVVMSWHTARLTNRWDQVAPADAGTVRIRRDVPASCRGRPTDHREGVWDAVIIDEAHNARRGSNFYAMLDRLRAHTQTYYLLTATPMQLHAGELYDLMALLDLPDEWDDREAFVEFFETRATLERALHAELDTSEATTEDAGESWSAQTTLDEGRYQDRLSGEANLSDRVFDRVAVGLDVDLDDGGQARSIAKQRVLSACTLAGSYGEAYDGYYDRFQAALNEHEIGRFGAVDDQLKYLLYPERKAREDEWLTFSRADRLDALDELSVSGWRVVYDVLAASTPVDALIHRNTRSTLRKYEQVGLLDTTVPDREPEQHRIDLTEETRPVYDRIDDYTRKFYKLAQQSDEADSRAIGFVMTTYRQRLTSSIYAISQSLQTRLEKLRAQQAIVESQQRSIDRNDWHDRADRNRSIREYGETEQLVVETLSEYDLTDLDALDELQGDLEDADLSTIIPNVTEEGANLLQQEIDELESFVADLRSIDRDPKVRQLIDDLDRLDREGHNRAIVFTQYTDTMDFIRDSLIPIHGETVATYSGRGGELYDSNDSAWRTVGKERVKREFSTDEGNVDILVCTDSASEGLNLQECGALINYDLPWNPMRVEQRIGRIDRIGQRHSEITILNYSYTDTVETDIYDRLGDRIGLFETVVGEMQPILSSVSNQIRSATLETEGDDRQQAVAAADREFAERISTQQKDHNRVDVGESLDSIETESRAETHDPNGDRSLYTVAQEINEEAKLDAWASYSHPDITDVGNEEYEYGVPFGTEALEAVLVRNEALVEAGIVFRPVVDLDINEGHESIANSPAVENIYRLTTGDRIDNSELDAEGTLAQTIAPEDNTIAVTFSARCADEFPSVQFLAPGNPLLTQLVETILEGSNAAERLSKRVMSRERSNVPLVCGWGRNSNLGTLARTGDVTEESRTDLLSIWHDAFTSVRDRT